MKKSLVAVLLLVVFMFIVGCVDYKAYDLETDPSADEDLLNEIAQVEDNLAQNQNDEVMENETVLPDLDAKNVLIDGEVQSVYVKENELLDLLVVVSDPDGDIVTWEFTPPVSKEGKWQTSYGDAGEYLVTLSATDGIFTTTKDLRIEVQRVNVPPTMGPFRDLIVKEGELVKFSPVVLDPNGDAVTVSVSEPLKDGSFATDHTSSGVYEIFVKASDGEMETTQSFKLTISDVNELPIIEVVDKIVVKEGDTVEVKPLVTDLDDDELVITISEPVGNDGVWETRFTDHGKYVITVKVDDGKDVVTKKIDLTVEDVNMPPQIVDVSIQN